MVQYIDKSALVAEIRRRIKEIDKIGTYLSPKGVLTNLLCHLNTLETKEVDLKAEINKWRCKYFHGQRYKDDFERISQLSLAKHFFELGLKTQKGE